MKWTWIVLLSWIQNCAGVVYFLNETEYDLLPRLFDLDEYDSCLRQQGTYCVAKFDIERSYNESYIQLIREYSEHTTKHFNYSYIQRGVCVTKRCKHFLKDKDLRRKEDVEAVLGACVNASVRDKYGLYGRLQHVYSCDTRDVHDQASHADWLVAALLLLLFGACIIGSFYDIVVTKELAANEKRQVNKYLLSFSIFCNLRWLIHDEETNIIKSFYGLKFFKMLCVVFAHVSLLIGATFLSNPHDKELAYEKLGVHLICNGLATVQAFFIISGILLAIKLESYREHNTMSWWITLKFILQRWWRLAPACAAMVAVSATWLRHLGSGPLWKMLVTENIVKDCRKYWWQHILFINNYSSDNKFCAMQTWHIAVEFQLVCIAIVIYSLLPANSTKLRNFILVLLFLIGVGGPAMHVWLYDHDPQVILSPEAYRSLLFKTDTFHYAHVYVYNNFSCYFMGMLFGHLAYRLQKDGWKYSPKSKIVDSLVSCLGWVSIVAVLATFVFGKILYTDAPRPSLQFRMFYAAIQRPLYGLCIFVCIFMTLFRQNDKFKTFLEWEFWTIPSRLTYSVYIVHFPILHVYAGSRRGLTYFSLYDEIVVFFGILMASYLLGLILFLLVESPTTRCCKLAMSDFKERLKEE